MLAKAQYPQQLVQYQPQAVQYQQQPKYQQQQTYEALPTPAQYPAGVDAQSCPNYPDCANPLVTLSAVAKASDPRYLVNLATLVNSGAKSVFLRPPTPPRPRQGPKASTRRTYNRNWTVVNTSVTVIITVKVWMKRKRLKWPVIVKKNSTRGRVC